jgi:sugar/nucleoside kinase (ribokinase family)
MQTDFDIFLPGDYFFDLIYRGLPEFPVLGRELYAEDVIATGGAMYITAVSLARLEMHPAWAATFGNDYYSEYVRALAVEQGLDMSLARALDQPFRRITTSIPYQGERAFLTYADPQPPDHLDHWLSAMEKCTFKHLHLGALMRMEILKPMVEIARSRGATISMDCQDAPNLQKACEWRSLLSLVDVFLPNAREALIVSGTSAVDAAIQTLMDWTNVVVIKDGANGAWIGTQGEIMHAPAIDAGAVVDTTGAGDCFNAGFLRGYVIEKAPLNVCARYGNICGGLSVTKVGGATAAPTLDQLRGWCSHEA